MDAVIENAFIERLTAGLPRSALQLNRVRESDAELIRLPGGLVLALTTDGIAEEIETGLYADPELAGWMTVLVNASDLAAVGAEPLGLLLNQTLPPDLDGAFIRRLQSGIARASATCRLPVLGGDTNFGTRLHLAATAVGTVDGVPLTRVGCRPGDSLIASGPLGRGGAFALARLSGDIATADSLGYRPRPRLAEGRLLRRFATCCMDTSDGVIPTLDELMQLNDVGFRIESPLEAVLDPDALAVCNGSGLPAWTLLAGPHGEFELLFTVPQEDRDAFKRAADRIDWQPIELGVVDGRSRLEIGAAEGGWIVNTVRVRNLFNEVKGDVRAYVAGLLRVGPSGGSRREVPAEPERRA
jgi:thiamine-monophosphate kinase